MANMDGEITQLLHRISAGDSDAAGKLIEIVYPELRRLASSRLRRDNVENNTLQPTALVHEAFLRLFGDSKQIQWGDRTHFFALAAQIMRHILVDRARHKRGQKKIASISLEGKNIEPIEVDISEHLQVALDVDIIALNDALEALSQHYPRPARIVMLRFFGGLTTEEVAEAEDLSIATVKRDWSFARVWLFKHLNPNPADIRWDAQ